MRGHVGALGGMGIFTKIAIKLHSWPGPPRIETEAGGTFVAYKVKEPLKRSKIYMVDLPNYEKLADFMYAVGDAEIAYSVIRVGGPEHLFAILAGAISNQTYLDWHDAGMISAAADEFNHPCIALIYANSDREFDFQDKLFNEIVEDVGGTIPNAMNESPFKELLSDEFPVFLIGNDTHWAHHGGGFVINAGYMGTTDSVVRHQGLPAEELKGKYMERGGILKDGLDSTYHNSFDNNSYIYMELEYHYDAADPESVNESRRCIAEERETRREEKDGFEVQDIGLCVGDANATVQERLEELGPLYNDFHIWQERIKRALDPNDVVDRSTYGIGTKGRDLKV